MPLDTLLALPLLVGKGFFVPQVGDGFALLVKPKEGLVFRLGLPSGRLDTLLAAKPPILWAWLWKDALFFTRPGRPFVYKCANGKVDSFLLDTVGCSKYPDPLVFYNGRLILVRTPRWTPQKPYDRWLHFYTPKGTLLKDDFPADNYAAAAGLVRFMGALEHNCDVGPGGEFWCTEPSSWRVWVFSSEGALEGIRGRPPRGWRLPKPVARREGETRQEIWREWERASKGAYLTTGVWVGKGVWAVKYQVDGRGIVQFFSFRGDSLLWEGELRGFAGLWKGKALLLSPEKDTLYVCRLERR